MNRYRKFIIFGFAVVSVVVFNRLPYLNLVFTPSFNIFALATIGILVFQVKPKFTIALVLVAFVIAAFLRLFGEYQGLETIGNFIYGILFVGLLQSIVSFLREQKKDVPK